MAIKMSKTEEILARLQSEGRQQTMDSHEDSIIRERMNHEMELVMRESQYKEYESQISASQFVLTK
jgi:hypothetical protein